MRPLLLFAFSAGCLLPGAVAQHAPDHAACAALASFPLEHAKVESAQLLPAATPVTGLKLGAGQVSMLPAFCRVLIVDRPTDDSDIRTEVWLPLAGWNGRVENFGNGGFAGEIAYQQLAAAVAQGYATAATDTGHTGGDPKFALGHPEKIKDFGWRAVHEMSLEARQIAQAFYGSAPRRAYFNGCSDGGREALMEAERFPADYDGILAGAPAYNWTALVAAGGTAARFEAASPQNALPANKIPLLAAAVRNACDAQDGVKDGILNDPRSCRFDPASLACKQGDAATCLTRPQVELVKLLYHDKLDSKGNKVLHGYMPGAEDARGGWVGWIVPEKTGDVAYGAGFVNGFFGDFVHQSADWKVGSFDLDRDLALAREKDGAALDATDTNLAAFLAQGGKLILYHGWNDPAIPALGTVDYFNGVASRLGKQAVDSSLRLYLVPGMLHCGGGPGAADFDQNGANRQADAQHDITTALEQWVEDGKAPGRLTARNATLTRPLCPYPQVVRYDSGDPHAATSFSCVEGPR